MVTEQNPNAVVLKAFSCLAQTASGIEGRPVLDTLVRELARCLGMKWCFVCRLHSESAHHAETVSFWTEDSWRDNTDLQIADTPLAEVLVLGKRLILNGVGCQYGSLENLGITAAESFIGMGIKDAEGLPLGLICALDDKPVEPPDCVFDMLSLFADRAAAELMRLRAEHLLQKTQQELERSVRSRVEFLSTVSHELLTPLNAVIGFSEMLLSGRVGGLTDRQIHQIKSIQINGHQLHHLIRDMLDLSQAEMGRLQPHLQRFEVRHAIDAVLETYAPLFARKELAFEAEISPDLGAMIADPQKLQKVMAILLDNAAKFNEDGGSIRLKVQQCSDIEMKRKGGKHCEGCPGAHCLCVSVQDTGIGIQTEDIEVLFNPFRQLDSSYAREYAGTGIGLALARHLITLHGGRIWGESEGMGKGSTFTFVIPFEPVTMASRPSNEHER